MRVLVTHLLLLVPLLALSQKQITQAFVVPTHPSRITSTTAARKSVLSAPKPLFSVPEDTTRVDAVSSESSRNLTAALDNPNMALNGAETTKSGTVPADNGSSPLDAINVTEDFLAIDPDSIDIVTVEKPSLRSEQEMGRAFVSMFRGSANYIANHRNTLAVYHIPGGLLDRHLEDGGGGDKQEVVRDLMNDIALTWLLGMKIVIVVGCRYQIDKRVPNRQRLDNGLVVTDEETLRVVKEEAGYVRFEVERQLARALRVHGGQYHFSSQKENNFHHPADGNVVSGNFYSAQPFGILDGVDFKYTGFVRRVEADKIRKVHQSRDICLLTTLGVSPSGECFNVNSESLAAKVASTMEASKIIFFTEQKTVLKHKVHGGEVPHLRVSDAKKLLRHHDVELQHKGFIITPNEEAHPHSQDYLLKIGWGVVALENGVKRAHILAPSHGALLQELYTRDGSGTLISRDLYEGIRRATFEDVAGISDLIQPLIRMGTLVDRPRAKLEKDVDSYYIYTRDNLILACGQLKKFPDGFAEIGCLVVNAQYRSQGRGDAMLGYLERLCVQAGCRTVFVLSTQTMEWFVERGFQSVGVERLPPSRQATYNWERRSKIYMKEITSDRDLDASELWWNR